jgi:hypothetical protein
MVCYCARSRSGSSSACISGSPEMVRRKFLRQHHNTTPHDHHTTPPHHHNTTTPHHHTTTTPQHHDTTIPQHTATPPQHHSTTAPHHKTTAPHHHHITTRSGSSSACRSGSPVGGHDQRPARIFGDTISVRPNYPACDQCPAHLSGTRSVSDTPFRGHDQCPTHLSGDATRKFFSVQIGMTCAFRA